MSDEDDLTTPQDVAENMPDGIPPPPFVGLDQYFDEPSPSEDRRADGLLGWAAKASKAQRGGLVSFAVWCAQAPDAERRVIQLLMEQYAGRVPMGAVNDMAGTAGCRGASPHPACERSWMIRATSSTCSGRSLLSWEMTSSTDAILLPYATWRCKSTLW